MRIDMHDQAACALRLGGEGETFRQLGVEECPEAAQVRIIARMRVAVQGESSVIRYKNTRHVEHPRAVLSIHAPCGAFTRRVEHPRAVLSVHTTCSREHLLKDFVIAHLEWDGEEAEGLLQLRLSTDTRACTRKHVLVGLLYRLKRPGMRMSLT
eukprot:5752710-Pleurochrysis_carterae.AAC.2